MRALLAAVVIGVLVVVGGVPHIDMALAGPSVTPSSTPTPTPGGPTPTPTPFGQTPGPSPTPRVRQGDFTCDGIIDTADVQLLLRQIAYGAGWEGPEPCPNYGHNVPPIWGDPDCDGTTTVLDLLVMLKYLANLPYTQTEPCPDIGAAFP